MIYRLKAAVMVALYAIFVTSVVALAGACGATQRDQHIALNAITDTIQPNYQLAVDACDEAEWRVVRREGSTRAEDDADITRLRRDCDRVFGAFEAVRIAQATARVAVDEAVADAQGALRLAMARLSDAWEALKLLFPEIRGVL